MQPIYLKFACIPYLNFDHWQNAPNQRGLRTMVGIFSRKGDGKLLKANTQRVPKLFKLLFCALAYLFCGKYFSTNIRKSFWACPNKFRYGHFIFRAPSIMHIRTQEGLLAKDKALCMFICRHIDTTYPH